MTTGRLRETEGDWEYTPLTKSSPDIGNVVDMAAKAVQEGSDDQDEEDDEMDDLPADQASDDELDADSAFGLQPIVKARYAPLARCCATLM